MIKIKTVSKGAELISIEKDGFERIHDGVKDWNRHSPILFPIVGKLKDKKTIICGKEYEMGQHGFARDMDFEKIDENSYVLKYNEETLKKYPFKFELYVSYEVEKNAVTTNYRIVNKDDKMIYFGLGGHPAFNCDYTSGQYRLEFEEIEDDLEVYQLENGLVKEIPEKKTRFIRENRIYLNNETFKNDAIIIKNVKSRVVYLKTETKTVLAFEFKDFPYLGIWSKPGAHFVCIEPWFNTADKVSSNGIFEEKEDLIELESNQEFEAHYTVKFFD